MIFSIFYHLEKPITLKPSNSASFCLAILPSFSLSPLTLYYNQQKKKKKNYRKGDLFQDPRVGYYITLGNELTEKIHVLTMQKTLLGRGT